MSPEASAIRYSSKTDDGKATDTKLTINFRPLGTRICICPISGEQTTKSGLIIPENNQGEKPQEGWVIGIGDEVDLEKKKLKVGDRVLFSRYAGDEIRIRDEKGKENEIKILHFESLLGVVESGNDEPKNPREVIPPPLRPDEKGDDGKGSGKELRKKAGKVK